MNSQPAASPISRKLMNARAATRPHADLDPAAATPGKGHSAPARHMDDILHDLIDTADGER
jgi:hypothetical protein